MDIDNFRGVYSSREPDHTTQTPGASGTRKRFWLVWADTDETVAVQPLSPSLEPAGARRIIPVDELHSRYVEEPHVVPSVTRPRPGTESDGATSVTAPVPEAVQNERLTRHDRRQSVLLDGLDFWAAEPEAEQEDAAAAQAEQAAEQKEQEMRADFGMALVFLKQGNRSRALQIFETLANEQDLHRIHKHMFTDFGISLRKSRLLDMALMHHSKAAELAKTDDHALHNVARIHYELGDVDSAVHFLQRSLELNPDLTASKRFLRFIRKRQNRL